MKPLSKWQIEVWRRLLDGSVVFAVLHNADNRGNRTGHVHLASNRSAIPEKAPDETLVHNDYRGRVAYISSVKSLPSMIRIPMNWKYPGGTVARWSSICSSRAGTYPSTSS